MRDWFENLDPRERLFVGIGGLIVGVAVFWGLIWLPLDSSHEAMRASVSSWQKSLSDLQRVRATVEANGAGGSTPISTQTPIVIVDQTLGNRGLNSAVTRRQPSPNGIRVEFENVAFDDLVLWLGELSSQYALDVQAGNLSVSSRGDEGRINASLTLERTL